MGLPPLTPKARPIRVTVPGDDQGSVQRALDTMHERVKDLEQRSDLSGSVAGSVSALSGSQASSQSKAVQALSGTLDAQFVHDGLDPLRGTRAFDDFIASGPTIFQFGGTGAKGQLAAWTPGHPGIGQLTVAASASAADALLTDGVLQATVIFGGGPIQYEACARLSVLDNPSVIGARRYVGVHDFSTPMSNGVRLTYDRVGFGDDQWRLQLAATGSLVSVATGVTAQAGLWYRLRIDVSPNGDAVTGSVYATGSLLSTTATTTYVPSAAQLAAALVWPGAQAIKTVGAAAMTMDLDYHYIQQTFTGSRQ
jgi:hypothetical protein